LITTGSSVPVHRSENIFKISSSLHFTAIVSSGTKTKITMKTIQQLNKAFIAATAVLMLFSSCRKEPVNEPETFSSDPENAIAIAANITAEGSASSSDSIYAVNACKKDDEKTSITESSLPATITTYIAANYSGSTFLKAFKITHGTADTVKYVVAIRFNNKPVALQFDANGSFIKVLELREKRNLKGIGWHLGGWFENRDWKHRDTIAVSSLSSAIKLYLSTTYPQDTLLHAIVNKDASIIVFSKNVDYFATTFNAGSLFVKRIKIPAHSGKGIELKVTELPVSVQTYLSTTYPNFVLHKAFAIKLNGTLRGYLVFIDASLTNYALQFDASGKFVSVITIR
jgi:hypothetical protein